MSPEARTVVREAPATDGAGSLAGAANAASARIPVSAAALVVVVAVSSNGTHVQTMGAVLSRGTHVQAGEVLSKGTHAQAVGAVLSKANTLGEVLAGAATEAGRGAGAGTGAICVDRTTRMFMSWCESGSRGRRARKKSLR